MQKQNLYLNLTLSPLIISIKVLHFKMSNEKNFKRNYWKPDGNYMQAIIQTQFRNAKLNTE